MVLKNEQCVSVYTLNTWTDEKKQQAREYLNKGLYVHFGSTAIGHTMAWIVENEGFQWARNEYKDRLEEVRRDGWGDIYCHLKVNA